MVSSRAKGNRYERLAENELIRHGWITYRVKGSTKFNKNVDIFGLFDIIGKNFDGTTIYVQVKTNRKPVLLLYQAFKWVLCNKHDKVQVWIYYERGKSKKWKGWRKIKI